MCSFSSLTQRILIQSTTLNDRQGKTSPNMASAGQNLKPKIPSIPQALFDSGLDTRRTVVGDAFVDRALANGSTEFSGLDQELVTGWCWEWATGRPGLAKRDLSLLNIGTLMALNRRNELGVHVRGQEIMDSMRRRFGRRFCRLPFIAVCPVVLRL